MSDIFYNSFLNAYKCSRIPILNGRDFTVDSQTTSQLQPRSRRSSQRPAFQSSNDSTYSVPRGHFNSQLRSLFTHVLMDMSTRSGSLIPGSIFFRSTSLANGSLDNDNRVDWKTLKHRLKISFKQEVMDYEDSNSSSKKSFIISYLMVRFPKEVNIKRQYFVFVQQLDSDSANDHIPNSDDLPSFNTLILLRTTFAKFATIFIKWCENSLGQSVIIRPLKFNTEFLKSISNSVLKNYYYYYHNTEEYTAADEYRGLRKLGDFTVEFKVKTSLGALNNIKIDIPNHDLIEFVHQLNKSQKGFDGESAQKGGTFNERPRLEIMDALFQHFQHSTSIDFSKLQIARISSNGINILASDDFNNKIQFYGGSDGLKLSKNRQPQNENGSRNDAESFQLTVYDVIFRMHSLLD